MTSRLVTTTDIHRADGLYAELVRLYEDLEDAEIARASVKLLLLLANHVGDPDVVKEAVGLVRADCSPSPWGAHDGGLTNMPSPRFFAGLNGGVSKD